MAVSYTSAPVDLLVPLGVTHLISLGRPPVHGLADDGSTPRAHSRGTAAVASLELNRVHERIPLQNVITSHTYAYPQPSDLTPYGAHKEMHPMLASDPDQMLGRTDRKPCPYAR